MDSKQKPYHQQQLSASIDLHQGDCIQLKSEEDLFQVIGIDNEHMRCWVRRWPLPPNGSPVFEVSMQQITVGPRDKVCQAK